MPFYRRLGARRAFALGALALELAGPADRSRALAGALLRRLLVVTAQLHLAIDALALQLLLERAQRLLDVIVANDDLHETRHSPFVRGQNDRPNRRRNQTPRSSAIV